MDVLCAIWRRLGASRQHPAVATMPVVALTTGAIYVLGGSCVLLVVLIEPPAVQRFWLTAIPLSAITAGVVILRWGRRFPRWVYHLCVLTGTILVTTEILVGRDTTVVGAAMPVYVFVVLDAAFFFSLTGVAAHVGLVLVVTSLLLPQVAVPWPTVLTFNGVCIGVGVVVAGLCRAADRAEEDPLTQLANRRGFDRRLAEAMARARVDGGGLFVVLIDLDEFKDVNDGGGHQRGDEVLRTCAERWRPLVPKHVSLARYGGDEFALVVPTSRLEAATGLAERLREAIAPVISASAGVAAWQPGDTASMLLHRADQALYDAKDGGRDQTVATAAPR